MSVVKQYTNWSKVVTEGGMAGGTIRGRNGGKRRGRKNMTGMRRKILKMKTNSEK